jgi:hypothetical protein
MQRIIRVLTLALVMAAMMAASVMPAFAQGQGPEGGNPGQGIDKNYGETVGAQDKLPLPKGGNPESGNLPGNSEAGYEGAGPALGCKAPGSPFNDPNSEC